MADKKNKEAVSKQVFETASPFIIRIGETLKKETAPETVASFDGEGISLFVWSKTSKFITFSKIRGRRKSACCQISSKPKDESLYGRETDKLPFFLINYYGSKIPVDMPGTCRTPFWVCFGKSFFGRKKIKRLPQFFVIIETNIGNNPNILVTKNTPFRGFRGRFFLTDHAEWSIDESRFCTIDVFINGYF